MPVIQNPQQSEHPTYKNQYAEAILRLARQTLSLEAAALCDAQQRLGADFVDAVQAMLECKGRVVVMGMGKSGHIGRKIAATFASTGTPAMFVHPAEASHGDLGMVQSIDVVLCLSNSGESTELNVILPLLKRQGNVLIAITGGVQSSLAKHASHIIDSSVAKEACPLNLAPTASTTTQLALGDALAVALLDARGFQAVDFAKSHPGGTLGRKLLTFVADVMRPLADLPLVEAHTSFLDVMRCMSAKNLGAALVVEWTKESTAAPILLGIFTDGDLRRLIEKGTDLRQLTAKDIAHNQPKITNSHALAVDVAQMMEEHGITSVVVVSGQNENELLFPIVCGMVHIGDLMRAKVI